MNKLVFGTLDSLNISKEMSIQTGPFGTQLKASEYVKEGIPVINVRNIGYRNEKEADLEYLDDKKAEMLKQHKLNIKDIVFGRKGAVDRHLIVKNKHLGWIQGSDCIRIRFNTDKIIPDFLSYFFLTEGHKKWMEAQGAFGATMGSLNQGIIQRISYPLFPIIIQKKIAAVLSAYDDLIENNNRRISILEKMAEELYKECFVRLRFPGYEKVKIVKGIPEGWEVKKIGNVVSFKYGFTESAIEDNNFPKFLRVMDINKKSYIKWSEVPNCKINDIEKNKYILNKNDLVIARMASPGKVAIIEREINAVFASYLIKMSIDKKYIYSYYLFYTLTNNYYQGLFTGADTSATRGNINGQIISKFNIIVPPLNIQKEFELKILPLRNVLNKYIIQNEALQLIRDKLLSRLMSGKIDVENLDIQFPESLLTSL